MKCGSLLNGLIKPLTKNHLLTIGLILSKEDKRMHISYNKLWKMLIDKNMKKSDLKEKTGISSASIAKLGKGDNITTDVLLRICETMNCHLEDIMETVDE